MTHVVGLSRETPGGKMSEVGVASGHQVPIGEEKLTA